jgi:hypothetical protein
MSEIEEIRRDAMWTNHNNMMNYLFN